MKNSKIEELNRNNSNDIKFKNNSTFERKNSYLKSNQVNFMY